MFWRLLGLLAFLIACCDPCRGGLLVIDDFEQQPAASGAGTPAGYFSFGGQLLDRGVSSLFGATSGTQSAVYDIDFSAAGFGVGAAHENLSLQLSPDTLLSVQIRTLHDLGNTGFIAFRLEDSDGSIYRTPDANLLSATTSFQRISQSVAQLTAVDAAGSTAGLNLLEIRSVGLLFFDQGFSGTHKVIFDDLTASVPEPVGFSITISIGMLLAAWSRKHRRENPVNGNAFSQTEYPGGPELP